MTVTSAPVVVPVVSSSPPAKKAVATQAPPLTPVAAKLPDPPPSTPPSSASGGRTHTVKQGDYPATIAKQYGIKLESLLAANPGLDPKRMKIGQTVTIPAP